MASPLPIHSFIHSRYFYSTSSSPLLLRGAPDTVRTLCQSFTLKCHRQLRVKDVAARAGFEPRILRTKGDKSINEPPCPTTITGHLCTGWSYSNLLNSPVSILRGINKCSNAYIHVYRQGFFVTVRAGTAYRHLFSQVKKTNYLQCILLTNKWFLDS